MIPDCNVQILQELKDTILLVSTTKASADKYIDNLFLVSQTKYILQKFADLTRGVLRADTHNDSILSKITELFKVESAQETQHNLLY